MLGAILIAAALVLPSSALAAVPSSQSISKSIVSDLHRGTHGSFEALLSRWENQYGTRAVPTLSQLTKDHQLSDPERYVALMGVAKIGGTGSAPLITPLLKDKSWMLRNGALRALSALHNPSTTPLVLPLLKDPALVVRFEAVQSVERLKPQGSAAALLATLQDPANFHSGRALWVPQRALEALKHLGAQNSWSTQETREITGRLTAMLDHSASLRDPSLKAQIQATLRSLTNN